jgi:hypothetical protein
MLKQIKNRLKHKKAGKSKQAVVKSIKLSMKSETDKSVADGHQYMVATPIAKEEYLTSSVEFHGVANPPSLGIAGVAPEELAKSIEVACRNKRDQIEALPLQVRGSLAPPAKHPTAKHTDSKK